MDFQSSDRDPALRSAAHEWASWYAGTGIARVLAWWFTLGKREHAPPPLPAWSSSGRVLAVLRPDWLATGDFLAVDQRATSSPCRIELCGAGRSWLGPTWTTGAPTAPTSRPKPRLWIANSAADLAEWSYRAGETRVTRSALLLRGRRLALLSVLVEGGSRSLAQWQVRVALPPAVAAATLDESRALLLTDPKRRSSAQVLPIGLPSLPYPTDRGRLQAEAQEVVLEQGSTGRRTWLPLLVSWDPTRHRKRLNWRALTVSERSRIVRPDRAFAARVSWGREETYVIYRSLGPPAPRAFLGYQTRARFLVGRFTTDGDVKPILSVD
jgi:hypothetical protein